MDLYLGYTIITVLLLIISNYMIWNKGINHGISLTLDHLEETGQISFKEEG